MIEPIDIVLVCVGITRGCPTREANVLGVDGLESANDASRVDRGERVLRVVKLSVGMLCLPWSVLLARPISWTIHTASPCAELTSLTVEMAYDILGSNIDIAAQNYGWPHVVCVRR
jgi:hypothetical protein